MRTPPRGRDFGENFPTYRSPIDTRSASAERARTHGSRNPLALNSLTPHQKWGIELQAQRGGASRWQLLEGNMRELGLRFEPAEVVAPLRATLG